MSKSSEWYHRNLEHARKYQRNWQRNNKKEMTTQKVDKVWETNPDLQDLFEQCIKSVETSEGGDWIEIENLLSDHLNKIPKEDMKKQGIYFFRALNSRSAEDGVRNGYIGQASSLSNRLGMHFKAKFKVETHKKISDCGDNLLKTWALTWLTEHGFESKGGGGSLDSLEVITKVSDSLVLNTLAEDDCESHDDAVLKLYIKLRPGNPAKLEKAKQLFTEKFYDTNRYRLGKVGRFRLNRKFELNVDEAEMALRPEDFLNTMKYIVGLRNNVGYTDDIDHLGNRRLRTIDELAADEVRKGLLKLRRTVQERMSMKSPEDVTRIADLVNSKSVSSSIDYFFGRGELSQVVDQTNALSQLTHERRLR